MNELMSEVCTSIREKKVFGILRGVPSNNVIQCVEALLEGNINILEVTFPYDGNPNETLRSVELINEAFGPEVICGVGTVTNIAQVQDAKSVGAQFVVSPNTDPSVIRYTKQQNLVSIPGALTPSEVLLAQESGADFVKLFPGGLLGSGYVKAISSVLKGVPIIAVGGITADNSRDFFKAGAIGIGVGGELVNAELVANNSFHQITQNAKAFYDASFS